MKKKYLVTIYSIAIFVFVVFYLSLNKNNVYTTQENIGKKRGSIKPKSEILKDFPKNLPICRSLYFALFYFIPVYYSRFCEQIEFLEN